MSVVGDKLRAIVSKSWGAQRLLAEKAGVSPEALSKILSGATKEPGFETIARLARAAGISLDELHDGEELPVMKLRREPSLSKAERRKLVEMGAWLTAHFSKGAVAAAGSSLANDSPEPANVATFPEPADDAAPPQQQRTLPRWSPEFPFEPETYIQRDLDYPRDLHAREYTALPVAAGAKPAAGETVKAYALNDPEVSSRTHKVSVVTGDSMEPYLYDGWKIMVDTRKRNPAPGDPVVVYGSKSEGAIVGFWDLNDGHPRLLKANPNYPPFVLDDSDEWFLLGEVRKIVDAEMPKMKV